MSAEEVLMECTEKGALEIEQGPIHEIRKVR